MWGSYPIFLESLSLLNMFVTHLHTPYDRYCINNLDSLGRAYKAGTTPLLFLEA